MFREDYHREMEAISPDEEQMARLFAVLEEEKPVKKQVFRSGFLAAALCAVLAATALAASSGLREVMVALLGSFAPYSQTMEGIVATDQGIEIKVVSALLDSNDGTAYVEVTDLTEDRLDETIRLRSEYTLRPSAYDPETKTALFEVPLGIAYSERIRGNTQDLEIHIKEIYTKRVDLPYEEMITEWPDGTTRSWWKGEYSVPAELYHNAEAVECMALTEDEVELASGDRTNDVVLVPEQTPMELGSEYFSLSSLGFDSEGSLHVQFKLAEGVYLMYFDDLDIDVCPGLSLDDVGLENGLSYKRILFGEGRYLDIRFREITREIAALLPDSSIDGHLFTAPPIIGEWDLEIPYAPLPERVVEAKQPFCVAGLELQEVRLSAMGLQLSYQGDTRIYMGGIPLYLFCRDGMVMKLDRHDMSQIYVNEAGELALGETLNYRQHKGEDGWKVWGERHGWTYPQAVDPQDVVGFSWGLWYVPLEGESAQPGRWLDSLPQPTK